jgi:hypothetical protein
MLAEGVWDRVFSVSPVVMIVAAFVLVAGAGPGGFAFAARDPHPSFQGATISSDGSTCSIEFWNGGNADAHLTQVVLSSQGASNAVSFASSFVLHPSQNSTYDCSLGSATQFLPGFVGQPGMSFNLTARFDDGMYLHFESVFS